jgi:hypothetical protein
MKGACKFGKNRCWFIHDKNETFDDKENNKNFTKENNEIIQKVFELMENFTERIVQIYCIVLPY